MSLYLKSAAYTPIETVNITTNGTLKRTVHLITALIYEQSERVLNVIRPELRRQISRHFLCSTMIELPFTSGTIKERDIRPIEREYYVPVSSFINTYECASWGYSLRYYLRQNPSVHYILVSILDVNILSLSFWKNNKNWGKSGFGLCTLLLGVEQYNENEITASCTVTYNTMPEFAIIIRKIIMGQSNLTLALPFFPEKTRQIFSKLLNDVEQFSDLHARWGHCFGSDPWLNIIIHGVNKEIQEHKRILACSLALNGYYCIAEVCVDQHSSFYLSEKI